MSTPEETLRLQRKLSNWAGTRVVAGWLVILFLVLTAAGVVQIVFGEASLGDLAVPLLLAVVCGNTRNRAKRKVREIEALL